MENNNIKIVINNQSTIQADMPAPTLIYSNLLTETAKREEMKRRRSTLTPQELSRLRKESRKVSCSYCHKKVFSETKTSYSMQAYFWFCFFFCCGGILYSWVPFVLGEMTETSHFCPNCRTVLGSYKPKYRLKTKILLAALTILCFAVVTIAVLCWSDIIKMSLFV